ncbi:RNA recognition motif domain-containing protein [Desulfovibrio inopinatus]|uniref:RNA recognition motif domain-containing protein n=1 Tax=Desulfovibrio inopinatus TaxID=102109 RepID=UPI000408AFA9|nr:RNA-binding protein [Desulfovibrio inopinatus]
MATSIYVGNLPWSTTEDELSDLFSQHGEVISAKIITDRETGRSRGFAFVEMEKPDADEAINALSGVDFGGRILKVNEAQPRAPRNNRW